VLHFAIDSRISINSLPFDVRVYCDIIGVSLIISFLITSYCARSLSFAESVLELILFRDFSRMLKRRGLFWR